MSYIKNSQPEKNLGQTIKHLSKSVPTQSTPLSSSASSVSSLSSTETEREQVDSIQQSQDALSKQTNTTQQQPVQQQPKSPQAKKLVGKSATFSQSRMKNNRQLIVETAICNWNGNGQQSDLRATKSADMLPKPKKKKRPPINITEGMSRAEIFAANVASAVDAKEAESDENEDFIYRGHTRTPSLTSLNGANPQNTQSSNFTYPHQPYDAPCGFPNQFPSNLYAALPGSRRNTLHTFSRQRPPLPGFYNGNNPSSEIGDTLTNTNSKKTISSPNLLLRSSLPDMSQYSKGHLNYGTAGCYLNDPFYSDWYGGGNNERLPLFAKWRPPYQDQRRSCCTPSLFSSATIVMFFVLIICYLVYLASAQPLTDISIVDVTNVLAADKEIMFDMHVKARNLGIWNVEIVDVDLKIFATPFRNPDTGSHSGDDADDDGNEPLKNITNIRKTRRISSGRSGNVKPSSSLTETAPSEYLGSVFHLDDPLLFETGASLATAQVTLKSPGGKTDKDARDKWSNLIDQGFLLTVRGVLKYTLPFSKPQSARVCYVRRTDGAGGSDDRSSNGNDGNNDSGNDSYSNFGIHRFVGDKNINRNMLLGVCGDDWDESDELL